MATVCCEGMVVIFFGSVVMPSMLSTEVLLLRVVAELLLKVSSELIPAYT